MEHTDLSFKAQTTIDNGRNATDNGAADTPSPSNKSESLLTKQKKTLADSIHF